MAKRDSKHTTLVSERSEFTKINGRKHWEMQLKKEPKRLFYFTSVVEKSIES